MQSTSHFLFTIESNVNLILFQTWSGAHLLWLFIIYTEKYCWKVNETLLFGSFQRKVSGSNVTSEKVVLFFRTE